MWADRCLPSACRNRPTQRPLHFLQAAVVLEQGVLGNNEQNATRTCKACTFLNKGDPDPIYSRAPRVLAKLLRFAMRAWEQEAWSTSGTAVVGDDSVGAPPLAGVAGVRSLSIRNVEHWHYDVGGCLDNDAHYDGGSIVTIVCALDPVHTGGVFRTLESDGSQLEHKLQPGDAVCFVSHKLHNVTPVLTGVRHSLVMELWEGGKALAGR